MRHKHALHEQTHRGDPCPSLKLVSALPLLSLPRLLIRDLSATFSPAVGIASHTQPPTPEHSLIWRDFCPKGRWNTLGQGHCSGHPGSCPLLLLDFRTHSVSFWEACRLSALSGNYPPLKSTACPGHERRTAAIPWHPVAGQCWDRGPSFLAPSLNNTTTAAFPGGGGQLRPCCNPQQSDFCLILLPPHQP